jgi:hypothetical protein
VKKELACELSKYYKVPISWIYEDTKYWENTYGFTFVSLKLVLKELVKDFINIFNKNKE